MQSVLLLGAAERERAFEIRARAYVDLLGDGVASYQDVYDQLPTSRLYGVYDKTNKMVASYRVCTDHMPFLDYCDIDPRAGSIELSRMSMDPRVKNPLRRTQAKIAAARAMMKFALAYGASDVYLMVRPGKGNFYRQSLGFKPRGITQPCPPATFGLELLSSPFEPLYEQYGKKLLPY